MIAPANRSKASTAYHEHLPARGREIHYSPVHLHVASRCSNTPGKVVDIYITACVNTTPRRRSVPSFRPDRLADVGGSSPHHHTVLRFHRDVQQDHLHEREQIYIGCARRLLCPTLFLRKHLSGVVYVKSRPHLPGHYADEGFIDGAQVAATNHPYFDQVVNQPAGRTSCGSTWSQRGNHFSRSQTVTVN